MVLENKIYVFTYALITHKVTKKIHVIIKYIPVKPTSPESLFNSYYIKLDKITNVEIPFKIFIPKQLKVNIICNEDVKCECKFPTFQSTHECWNTNCKKFKKVNVENLLSIDNSEIIKSFNAIQSEASLKHKLNGNQLTLNCQKCMSCKKCIANKKCTRHKICKHKNVKNEKKYYHALNKLAMRNSIQSTNTLLK